jgi:Domain of unknown function (DUF1830)
MSYFFPLLSELLEKEPGQVLCYYINRTNETQIIHVMNPSNNQLKYVVFPEERILFTAFPDAHLEINLSRTDGTFLDKIPCNLLNIHKDCKSTRKII